MYGALLEVRLGGGQVSLLLCNRVLVLSIVGWRSSIAAQSVVGWRSRFAVVALPIVWCFRFARLSMRLLFAIS